MKSLSRSVVSVFLVMFVLAAMLYSGSVKTMGELLLSVERQFAVEADPNSQTDSASPEDVKSGFDDHFFNRSAFIWQNGRIAKLLNMRGYYGNQGVLVYNGNYIVSASGKTSTDYEIAQLQSLDEHVKKLGKKLLYINAPNKYLDDSIISEGFGIGSYSNGNQDAFVQRLRTETDIPCIDLRENIAAEGKDIYSMFYRTDHHWTVPSGKWAARAVAAGLNEYSGYNIDLSMFDDQNYDITYFDNAWVGEQGRKISEGYIGRDSFVCMEPKSESHYIVKNRSNDTEWSGGFEVMLNKSVYENGDTSSSWHYSYMPYGLNYSEIINHDVDSGKILYLCDSYSYVVIPFLSRGVHDITTIIRRSCDVDIMKLIEEEDFDTVVILYAPFMIGAHDHPNSVNAPMFNFDPTIA